MKEYQVQFSFAIGIKGSYSNVVHVNTTDYVPQDTDPVQYLRERIGSEIKRVTKEVEFDTTV